ncbi:hypothetical protein M427DRAFT_65120 [Gonapodya prolifera JEL478]|uniref:HMG box domain-containing protein n=1 Tax=Gonapodya prolifera (strain JEL478) TaxID=1344416 RepID=A0A139AZ48_GONPJ|nr:hypothetical protein M427DRAFT_65120 [Gonapodya prolifera JEL478]|eukprot:KXS21999.1 hypothetical protein M427DRAFT_65120 [Gonapodya prolifera JEL478]
MLSALGISRVAGGSGARIALTSGLRPLAVTIPVAGQPPQASTSPSACNSGPLSNSLAGVGFSGLSAQIRRISSSAPAAAKKLSADEIRTLAERSQLKELRKADSLQRPKRPLSAFAVFTKERFPSAKIMKTGAEDIIDTRETIRTLAQTWKSLSDSQKEPYFVRADALREKYDSEVDKFEKSQTPEDFVKQQRLNFLLRKYRPNTRRSKATKPATAPSRPLTGYMRWAVVVNRMTKDEQRAMLGKSLEDVPFAERGKILGARWKAMSEQEKLAYQKAFETELVTYRQAMLKIESKTSAARQVLVQEVRDIVRERKASIVKKKKPKASPNKGARRSSTSKRRAASSPKRRVSKVIRKKPTTKKATKVVSKGKKVVAKKPKVTKGKASVKGGKPALRRA